MTPGGRSKIKDVNAGMDRLHPDAGIRWWLEYIKGRYGAWNPPPPLKPWSLYILDTGVKGLSASKEDLIGE